jgi:type I restriction enzyme S subunit
LTSAIYDLPHHDRRPGPFPIVSSAGVTDYHAEAKARGPGVVTGRYGTLGEVFFVEGDFWPLNTALYVRDFKGSDPRFISYFLRQLNFGTQNAAGAVPGVNRNHLHAMDVRVPPPGLQLRIAAVLVAYDNLIENCERRIRVLDEMARTLYREWFVLFRYPGHERQTTPATLPNGWQRVPVSQVYAGLYDGPHATPAPSSAGPVFLGIGNLTADARLDLSEVRHIAEEDFSRWTKRVTPQAGDIVFTYEATLHRYALIPDGFRGCLGRRLALIRTDPAKRCTYFLFFTLLSDAWREVVTRNILSGATVDRIPLSRLPDFPINLPPAQLVARFDEAVRPMVDQQARLIELKANLRKTRDLLLPRLLSGQLAVEDVA